MCISDSGHHFITEAVFKHSQDFAVYCMWICFGDNEAHFLCCQRIFLASSTASGYFPVPGHCEVFDFSFFPYAGCYFVHLLATASHITPDVCIMESTHLLPFSPQHTHPTCDRLSTKAWSSCKSLCTNQTNCTHKHRQSVSLSHTWGSPHPATHP